MRTFNSHLPAMAAALLLVAGFGFNAAAAEGHQEVAIEVSEELLARADADFAALPDSDVLELVRGVTGNDVSKVVAERFGDVEERLLALYARKDLEPLEKMGLALWLGELGTEQGARAIIAELQKPLPEELTVDQWHEVVGSIIGLGRTGTKPALDMLKQMMQTEFWGDKAFEVPERNMSAQGARMSLRLNALTAFAWSGAEEALADLTAGAGYPEDLAPYLEENRRVCQAIRDGEDPYPDQHAVKAARTKTSAATKTN